MPQDPRQRDGCRFTAQNITAAQEKNPFAKISDIVYELLEKAIFSSAIPPGSKLNISKLAEQMGVSTSPVTRAVERLEENGLVTAVRSSDSKYRSYFVFDLSSESLEDLFVARRAIEGEAAFLCAQKRTLIDLPRLQKLADQFQSAWQDFAKDLDTAPTASERAKIDLEFHHQLVLTTENEYLIDMFETLQGTLHYLSIRSCEFVATEQKKDNLIVMGSQHVAICSAIGLGLPELARSAMERHIDFCCRIPLTAERKRPRAKPWGAFVYRSVDFSKVISGPPASRTGRTGRRTAPPPRRRAARRSEGMCGSGRRTGPRPS